MKTPFTRGKPRKDKKTGEIIPPKQYRRSGATVNRYIATLSHLFSFAVKERRLIGRNPGGDIRRKKEPRGRTRFLSDEERAALLHACANSEWMPLHALVLLAITIGARRGELVSLKWADVDLKAGRATIHDMKNGEQRTLPVAGRALEALRQLKLQNSARSEYLFPSLTVVLDPETGQAQLDAPYPGQFPEARASTGALGDWYGHLVRLPPAHDAAPCARIAHESGIPSTRVTAQPPRAAGCS